MKKLTAVLATAIALVGISASTFASPIDLGTLAMSPYEYDSTAGTSTAVTKISFDYSYGNASLPIGQAAFRIRRLNTDGTDSWLASINIYSSSFNVDTDFGPYSTNLSLYGSNHFEFILNRTTGLWNLLLNDALINFYSTSETSPQPDSATITPPGTLLTNKYFSDESPEAKANASALYPGKSIGDGVGGTGAYRLEFTKLLDADGAAAQNAFVDNIGVDPVPEPSSLLLLVFGFFSLTGIAGGKRKS